MTTDDKIKVFMPDDDSLKTLGELLSSDTSRKIIKILIENEMYTNEISKKLGITPNVVIHHLKKLEVLGLINVVSKPISRKTKNHNFYRFNTDIFLSIMPEKKDESKLSSIFKDGIKFASVGIVSIMSWIGLNMLTTTEPRRASDHVLIGSKYVEPEIFVIIIAVLIIASLITIFYFKKKKKN